MKKGYVILVGVIDDPTYCDDGILYAGNMNLATKKVFKSKQEAIDEMVKIRQADYFEMTDENDGWASKPQGYLVEYDQNAEDDIEIDVYDDGSVINVTRYKVEEVEL